MTLSKLPLQKQVLSDGAAIHYVREGKGLPLIFVHSAMSDYRYWRGQWNAFRAHFDCIALSTRFSYPNGNEHEAPDFSAVEDGRDLLEFLDLLEIEKAIFMGASYGGFASLALATQSPERVHALIAIEPPMLKYAERFEDLAPHAENFREKAVRPSRLAHQAGDDRLGIARLTSGIIGAPVEAIPDYVLDRLMENKMMARRIALSSDEFPLLAPEALVSLQMPVLLMQGQSSQPVFHAVVEGVRRTMPQAEFVEIEKAGHNVPLDQAEAFNKAAVEFLTRRL